MQKQQREITEICVVWLRAPKSFHLEFNAALAQYAEI